MHDLYSTLASTQVILPVARQQVDKTGRWMFDVAWHVCLVYSNLTGMNGLTDVLSIILPDRYDWFDRYVRCHLTWQVWLVWQVCYVYYALTSTVCFICICLLFHTVATTKLRRSTVWFESTLGPACLPRDDVFDSLHTAVEQRDSSGW